MFLSRKNQIAGEKSLFTLCEELKYLREPLHQRNEHAVSVCSMKTNHRIKLIEQFPGAIAKVIHGVLKKVRVEGSLMSLIDISN